MDITLTILALITGAIAGDLFAFFNVPIPAPPEFSGVMGIVGVYVGYKLISRFEIGYDIVAALGL